MRRIALVGCLMVVVTLPAYARGHGKRHHHQKRPDVAAKSTDSFFLAGDPHVPLAVVKSGRIDDKDFSGKGCGEPKRWKKLGSSWRALDAWGQPIGSFTATAKDDYDATGCAELSFTPDLGADELSHVFVSSDSAWQVPRSAEWAVPDGRRTELATLAKANIPDDKVPSKFVWSQCASIPERARFFTVPGRGDWAIATSNAGWFAAKLDDAKGWTITSRDATPPTSGGAQCFRPVAVFDMDGDGVPEIVLRFSGGDGWNEVVLALQKDDSWTIVSSSPGGSTA